MMDRPLPRIVPAITGAITALVFAVGAGAEEGDKKLPTGD